MIEIKIDYDDVWLHSLSHGNLLTLHLFEEDSTKTIGSIKIQFNSEEDIRELCETILNDIGNNPSSAPKVIKEISK